MLARRSPRPRRPRGLLCLLSAALVAATLASPLTGQGRATPESVGMSSERLQRLTGAMEGYVADGLLPGAVVLVLRDGRVVYEEAFGHRDLESRDPQEVDDIFRIASQTKAVVSVAALMLQEEGRLLIEDPVGRYLPEFMETTVAEPDGNGGYTVVPARRPMTVRDLLTHTAGVGYYVEGWGDPAVDRWREAGIQGWYLSGRDEPIRETVRRMADLPFSAHPGERWIYGYATDILGAVVESAAGMPLDEYLRVRIFEPLGMTDTHFFLPPEKRDRLATVYGLSGGRLFRTPDGSGMGPQGDYVDGPRRSFSGGAGLLSTARDYARFLQAVLNGGELEGARILSPKSVELMLANHVGDLFASAGGTLSRPGVGFGLGFQVVEDLGARGLVGSTGEFSWGGAYHSTYWGDTTEKLVVVYFTQLLPAAGVDDHAKLRTLIYQAVTESYRR